MALGYMNISQNQERLIHWSLVQPQGLCYDWAIMKVRDGWNGEMTSDEIMCPCP